MDVKTAFLYVELDKMIIITQPEGYVDPVKSDWVCHLRKSLYGLQQSSKPWYLRFDTFITQHSFNRCNFDCCVYFKDLDDYDKIYLLLYVDDILIVCKHMNQIDMLKEQLKSEFEMRNLGPDKKILRVELVRNRKESTLFFHSRNTSRRYLKSLG